MANNIAFQQMGPTFKVSASSPNTSSNVVTINATSPVNQYFVSNPDPNNDVFVAYSTSSNVTASFPTSTGSNVIHIPAYAYKVFSGPQCGPTANVYAAVIGVGSTPTVYVCAGEGL
jgi:hypothetical protein